MRELGQSPELMYEPSYMNQALVAAGLPVEPEPVGITYSAKEIQIIAGNHGTAQERREAVIMAVRSRSSLRKATRPVSVARPAPSPVDRWHAPRPLVSGDIIKAYRERLGINRFSLARRVGVHFSTVCAWETGRTQPAMEHLDALADLFDVPVSELTGKGCAA